MSLMSAAPTFRAALKATATAAFAADQNVLVTMGMPAWQNNPDTISIGPVTSRSEPANLSPLRQREEELSCEVIIYSMGFGGAEQEDIVSNRAYELLGVLEQYVRVTDTTLGGAVRSCFLTEHGGDQATDDSIVAVGRMYVISATFAAANRITS